MATMTRADAELALAAASHPAHFARVYLGHDVWAGQQVILDDLARYRRVAVKACHSSSKTFTAAEAVLWWLACYEDGKVVTTAPTWVQVERQLWGEIRMAAARCTHARNVTRTAINLGPGRFAVGLSTNEGVRFQGFHGGHILLILDEAPGVRGEIWEAIEGISASGDVRILALGNPTISSGPFYDAFTRERALWHCHTIDAFDTPNLLGDPAQGVRAMTPENVEELTEEELDWCAKPYLVARRWVRDLWVKCGRDPLNPIWQARARGQFPLQSEQSLLWLDWLEKARYREAACPDALPLRAGIDVAGPGEDETVAYVVEPAGGQVVAMRAWTKPDPRGEVVAFLAPYEERLARVNVDAIGIGYYFARHLRDQGYGDRVVEINVGTPATNAAMFLNQKAELYWALRLRFQEGAVGGLADEETIAQLASIRYEHTARGLVQIESKDEAKKRGVSSPDRAEALMLAYTEAGVPGIVEYYRRLVEAEQAKREAGGSGD